MLSLLFGFVKAVLGASLLPGLLQSWLSLLLFGFVEAVLSASLLPWWLQNSRLSLLLFVEAVWGASLLSGCLQSVLLLLLSCTWYNHAFSPLFFVYCLGGVDAFYVRVLLSKFYRTVSSFHCFRFLCEPVCMFTEALLILPPPFFVNRWWHLRSWTNTSARALAW